MPLSVFLFVKFSSTAPIVVLQIFQLVCGLFGTIAYAGGIGMIFSTFTFLASLGGFIMAFVDNDTASLELPLGGLESRLKGDTTAAV